MLIRILLTAGLAFALVKATFIVLSLLAEFEDEKIYRDRLDVVVDKLDAYTMYELAILAAERIRSRVKLTSTGTFVVCSLLLALFVITTNYLAVLISFAMMAKRNVNFDFANYSIPQISWLLFRELGFTGSQQILFTLAGNSFSAVLAFFLSRRLLLSIKRTTTARGLASAILKQLGVFILIGAMTVLFVYLSVLLYYFTATNTETQQYFYTQTVRMLYGGEQPLPFMILVNTIASTVPSVLFFLVLLLLMILKLIPKLVRKKLSLIVFKVTTDDKPVLSQLGSFFGFLAGLIGAVISYVK